LEKRKGSPKPSLKENRNLIFFEKEPERKLSFFLLWKFGDLLPGLHDALWVKKVFS